MAMRLVVRRYFFLLATKHVNIQYKTGFCTKYKFESEGEIPLNFLNKIMLIGINLPESKNVLTQSALEKLRRSIEMFEKEDDFSVAVLHGFGGNFCTGLDLTGNHLEKGHSLIRMMDRLKKPLVCSLHGHVKNYGFQLALMCDIKIMDETALIGFGERKGRENVPEEVKKNLVSLVGMSRALEMTLMQCNWNAQEAKSFGLVNHCVKCGSALGQAVSWAQNIAMIPTQVIIQEKLQMISYARKGFS